jgi:multiple sugar transport system substrate-binding protein
MNHRTWRPFAALTALALVLAACGGTASSASDEPDSTTPAGGEPTQSDAAEPVTITYFTFSAAPDHLEDLDAIVQAFQDQHPNVTVEVQTASFDEYFTQLSTQIAGGTAPDTFEINYENFVTYAEAGSLLELSPIADADADFDPARYYARAYEVFQREGALYGLPATFSDVILFYNKGLFDAAGLDYPTADWTWEEERAAAEALTDADAGVWGDFQPIQFFEFYKVLAQNGGAFFSEDGSQATFNSPEGVEAAEWLIDKVGTVMPTEADMGGQDDAALFKSGNLAMWHNGIWQFAGMADAPFEWDIALEPGNEQKAHHFFANAAVASATTEHPEEAFAWIRFLTGSDEAVQTRIDASWELAAVADQSLFEPYLAQTPPESRDVVFEALDAIVVPPVIEQQAQMQDIVSQELARAVLGEVSAQEALDSAAEQVQALLP